MLKRVIYWGVAGITVGILWVLYGAYTGDVVYQGTSPLLHITAPGTLWARSQTFNFYEFLALNALIYAGAGLVVEVFRSLFAARPTKF